MESPPPQGPVALVILSAGQRPALKHRGAWRLARYHVHIRPPQRAAGRVKDQQSPGWLALHVEAGLDALVLLANHGGDCPAERMAKESHPGQIKPASEPPSGLAA